MRSGCTYRSGRRCLGVPSPNPHVTDAERTGLMLAEAMTRWMRAAADDEIDADDVAEQGRALQDEVSRGPWPR